MMAEAIDTSRDCSETEPETVPNPVDILSRAIFSLVRGKTDTHNAYEMIDEEEGEEQVAILSRAMLSLVRKKEIPPEDTHNVYEWIDKEEEDTHNVYERIDEEEEEELEEEQEENVDMRKKPKQDEESPYMSFKTCLKDFFVEDMRNMVQSMRISQISEKIEENKPPPLPPRTPGAKPKVTKDNQEDTDVPTDYSLMSLLIMHNVDSNKLSFLKQSDTCRKRLTDILKQHQAVIKWSNVSADRIVALETREGPGTSAPSCQQDIKSWRETAESAINRFLDDILVLKIPFMHRAWAKIKETDSFPITNPNPEEVDIRLSDQLPEVTLVGSHTLVPQVAENITELVRKIEGGMDKDMSEVVHQKQVFIDLKPWQFRYLQIIECSVFLESKYRGLSVEINAEGETITLSGQGTDIMNARIKIDETLKTVQHSTLPNVHKILLFAFTRVEFQNYIRCKLAAKNLHAVIEVLSDKLWIHARDLETVAKASTVITESVKVTYLKTDMLTLAIWKTLIEDIRQRVKDPFIIDRLNEGAPAVMACAAEGHEIVMAMLKQAVERSSMLERKLGFERGIFLAITRCCSASIEDIKKKYEVDVSFDHASFLVKVVGPKSQISSATGELLSLSDDVVVKYSSLDKPGSVEFLKSLSGNNMMKVAEDAHVCVIDIEENTHPVGSRSNEEMKNDFKAKVTVVKGDITKQLVDVIVTSVSKHPTHKDGTLIKAVSEAAGTRLQKEQKKKLSKRVAFGELTVTSGGNLRCKNVFHCCLPAWDKEKENIKVFRKAVMSCLKTANVSNYTSIAFPAMGCGGLAYPPHLAAKALFDAVSLFERTTESGLQEITVVVFDTEEKTYKIFENERNNRLLGTVTPSKDVGGGDVTGVGITVKVGELSETKADVIVNTTNKELRLNTGAVSMAILREGGRTIQEECNTRYRKGIKFGDVLDTGGGNLRCKKVFHTCLPKWQDSSSALQLLTKTVDTCLQMAPSRGYETIAFPALGTGVLQYPPEKVAQVFKERVAAFSAGNPLACLREVIIVLYHKDEKTTNVFNEAFDSDPTMIREPATMDRMKSEEFRLGPLRVEVKVGTVYKEKVDTLVVPTNNKVSLNGLVAILKSEYGPDCMVGSDRANITKSGAVVVPAQNMPCTNVMLVSTEHFKNNVEEVIRKCVRKADKLKIMSLAIGHLIPEGDDDAEEFATGMEKAIIRHKTGLKFLSDVRIILDKREQMSTCVSILQKTIGSPAMRRSFHLTDKDGLSSGSKPHRYKSKSMKLDDKCLIPLPRLCLLAMTKGQLEACSETVSAILQKIETEILTDPALETLPDDMVSRVTSLCADLHVLAQVDRNNRMVHFHGCKEDVMAAIKKTREVVRAVTMKHQTRERAESIQTSVQWYMTPPGGVPKTFPSVTNMLLEQAYKANLPSATFEHSGVTVTADFRTSQFHMPTQSVEMSRIEKRAAMPNPTSHT